MKKEFTVTKDLIINSFLFNHRDFNESVMNANMNIPLEDYLKKITNKKVLKSIESSILNKVLIPEQKYKTTNTVTGIDLNLYKCTIKNKVFTCCITVIEKDNDKEELLIWLKEQMLQDNIIEFPEIEGFTLTVVDGVGYGNAKTIVHWRNHLPKNSWKIVSDEPVPQRTPSVRSVSVSQYDPEYMRDYYHVRKLDKYKMKIKIQSEAVKLGMTYANYRKQFYPNFTFRDEKVKFSITNTNINTTVDDLLKAYISVPI